MYHYAVVSAIGCRYDVGGSGNVAGCLRDPRGRGFSLRQSGILLWICVRFPRL